VERGTEKRGVDAESLIVRTISNPNEVVVSARSVKETLFLAYGAVSDDSLPFSVEGFKTETLLQCAKDWLGDDGLAAFRYKVDIGAGEITYYNLPMLKIWAFQNKTLLDRVIDKNWPTMPMEKATLWAAQEMAARRGVPLEDVVSAIPKQVYVSAALYSEFMAIYRENKQTLTGEELAAAIAAFTQQLSGDLNGIRQAIESLDMNTTAQLSNINQSIASMPAPVTNIFTRYELDLNRQFGRRVWGRR
jgi:hypothetical protein